MNGQDKTGPNTGPNTGRDEAMTATEFADMIAAYGADTTRWPASKRAAAGTLVSGDPIVRISLSEAGALDRILAAAPVMAATRASVLADRIAHAAQHSPRLVVPGLAMHGATLVKSARAPAKQQAAVSRALDGAAAWQGAALLAASLLMGVFVGQTDISGRALPALVEMAGLTLDQTGLDTGHADHWDED